MKRSIDISVGDCSGDSPGEPDVAQLRAVGLLRGVVLLLVPVVVLLRGVFALLRGVVLLLAHAVVLLARVVVHPPRVVALREAVSAEPQVPMTCSKAE